MGRPRIKPRWPPLTKEERDALVEDFLRGGGVVRKISKREAELYERRKRLEPKPKAKSTFGSSWFAMQVLPIIAG